MRLPSRITFACLQKWQRDRTDIWIVVHHHRKEGKPLNWGKDVDCSAHKRYARWWKVHGRKLPHWFPMKVPSSSMHKGATACTLGYKERNSVHTNCCNPLHPRPVICPPRTQPNIDLLLLRALESRRHR
jgi:hypothetical protein